MNPHPDRLVQTLAQRALRAPEDRDGPFDPPGPGSDDARVPLKLLAHRTREALRTRGTAAATARLAGLDGADLWAGTVQDGTARGFAVALEEALSLCEPVDAATGAPAPASDHDEAEAIATGRTATFDGVALRRKRDILVASAGARLRFSRKGGILLVDRRTGIHAENCIGFEDRADTGTLDAFAPREQERARLFSPGFLQPELLEQGPQRDLLVLAGRLGRRANGYPCRIRIEGRKDEGCIRLTVAVENRQHDHRLRIRFRGLPPDTRIESEGTPGWEHVHAHGRRFVAATLVRACGRLRVGDELVSVPDAQCIGTVEHHFMLGAR